MLPIDRPRLAVALGSGRCRTKMKQRSIGKHERMGVAVAGNS